MTKSDFYQQEFIRSIVFWGVITCLIGTALTFVPALYLWLVHGVIPPLSAILSGTVTVLGFSAVFWFVEPLAYYPILGIPSTYLAFLSGNISNMRLPCAVIAQEAAGVKAGSEESVVITTLGVGASILVTLLILALGMVIGGHLVAVVPAKVQGAFNYILPAVFGGAFGQFALRDRRLAWIALVLACLMALCQSFIPQWIGVCVSIFGTIFIGLHLAARKAGLH